MTEKKRVKNEDPFMTAQEAAEYCHTTVSMIYERIRTGDLTAIRLGARSLRIRLSDLRAWWEWETSRGAWRA
jgi:excisionase family DNA binding protein